MKRDKKFKQFGSEDDEECAQNDCPEEETQAEECENTNFDEECACDEECTCEDQCSCHGEESSSCQCSGPSKADEYLEMARRIQAEFENFRKRTDVELARARQEGEVSVIEAFLPCLDTFKIAKKSITDPTVLEGVEMIESNIIQTLEKLGVEKIEAVGQKYDHNLHNVIALTRVDDKEDGIILDEYQAGYKYKDKVIRYSKVIVNKKED